MARIRRSWLGAIVAVVACTAAARVFKIASETRSLSDGDHRSPRGQ